ncbi:cell division ATP-binding protein FtsE [Cohnella fermenti]|uniref:ABC transporter ATP-binding protein n=1 Tax=Cohnella fermenti TaxID=2565925 RepID=A0A4V3WEC4_9BACL|nr:ABC transporter ATP-binding protein [Cohnella fermenti]THF75755.1 ABC transporter ATP-binding protein [Cohnella fermenti]
MATTMATTMIRIEGLCASCGGRSVLDDVHFRLERGEFAYLRGRSGSGKSTLLKLLYRELSEFEGAIEVAGRRLRDIPRHELRRMIGVVFQSFELLEGKTVYENIAMAGDVRGMPRGRIREEAMKLLGRVSLDGRANDYPAQLSGGEQQRVAIVRALLGKPELLLADEPTGNLDSETAAEVLGLLRELQREQGMAMLVVTHSQELIDRYPATVWEMAEGKVRRR